MVLPAVFLLLVVVITVVAISAVSAVLASQRHARAAGSAPARSPVDVTSPRAKTSATSIVHPHQRRAIDPRLGIQLDRWVAAGLLSADQADAIAEHEGARALTRGTVVTASPPPAASAPRRRIPVVAEALGYIGGILGTVGLVLLIGRYWDDMATVARVGIAGTAAVALVCAGWVVHEALDPALARLRWTLWLASTAATALCAFVIADRALELHPDERIALVIAAAIAFESAVLWWNRPRPIQQITTFAGLAVATGLLFEEFTSDTITGAALWLLGVTGLMLGVRRLTTLPTITLATGAIITVVGTFVVASVNEGVGLPLVCLDAGALLALALAPDRGLSSRRDRIALGTIGTIALLQGLPQTLVWFGRDAGIATGFVVWAIGALLLVVAAHRRIRGAIGVEVVGSIAMIGGAAISGAQSVGFATVFGVTTAIGFVAFGMLPGRVLMSLFGSAGLLAFVPWTIAHYFPGEGRAPLLILVSGALLVGIAVLLARQGGRFRRELASPEAEMFVGSPTASEAGGVDVDAEEHAAEGLVESG